MPRSPFPLTEGPDSPTISVSTNLAEMPLAAFFFADNRTHAPYLFLFCDAIAFKQTIVPAFDAMPEIIPRYAWFAAHGKKNKLTYELIDQNNAKLTALGQFYNTN